MTDEHCTLQFSILCSSCDRHDDSASGCLLHSRARDKCVELNDEGKLRWGECADLLKDKKGSIGKEERVSFDRPQSCFDPILNELIASILHIPGISPQASNLGYFTLSEFQLPSFVPSIIPQSLTAPALPPFVNMEHFFHGYSLHRNTRKHRQTLSVAVYPLHFISLLLSHLYPSYSLMRPLAMFFSSFSRHCRSA